ncbi:isoprenylcysteine carboxylmethyltransferase family protein [Vibrio sp. 99-70-13A1]|uniref:methyltransferase family protein n=1 Tax=Vibrio sp. 99-70-13A1 TaxID=2607601 RepID=UPI0014933126|nr:isoprenylcysteine carboxylmethyltransferase family protein [Vibrio sp. 99-70-13A1]NOH97383.1 isoprenylcysteine carboxylmethyltransferase family protein [Vibrio sp. 99-70-13A1]
MQKLLPPVLFLIFIIAMGLMCWSISATHLLIFPFNLIGLPIISAGLMLAMTGKQLFKKLETNIMTFDEPTMLVTEGIYQYTRNPMYLGFTIAMLGFSMLMGASVVSLLMAVIFLFITDRWYISFEEQMMHTKFGKDYEEYCRKVRRWI